MRDMIASEILLESHGIDLFGDPTADLQSFTVRGKIRLFLAKPRRIARIQLRFTGKSQTKVLDDLDDQFPTVQLVNTSSSNLIESSTQLTAGLTDIPFALNIPGDIPASCTLPQGHIAYTLSADIMLDTPLNKLRKPISIEIPVLVRRSFLTGLNLLAYMPSAKCRGQRRLMMAEFEAPKVTCLESGSIVVHGKVLGCFNKIVVRLEQLTVYRLCSNDPKRPTTMGPLFDKPVVKNTIPFEKQYEFQDIVGDMEENIVAEIQTTSPKTPLYTDVRSPLIEVCHRLRVNVHWVDKKEQTMSLAYPIVLSTLPFKDVSARTLADLAPPNIRWTPLPPIGSESDDQIMEDVRHDNELPSYCRLIPTLRPYTQTSTVVAQQPILPLAPNPPTAMPVSVQPSPISIANGSVLEDGVTRALRSVRSIMTRDTQGVGVALAKMFP